MKTFLILLLGAACLLLFYTVQIKSRQLEEQEAMVADLTRQLDAAKQAHATDRGDGAAGAKPAPVPVPQAPRVMLPA